MHVYDLHAYSSMIRDSVRTDAYARALRECVTPDSVVLDMGTGVGRLAPVRQVSEAMVSGHSQLYDDKTWVLGLEDFYRQVAVAVTSRARVTSITS